MIYSLTVDGHEIQVSPGTSVLEAARMAGVSIPTLCHHPALPADGSCRLCLVGVDGRRGLHAAYVLPATDGLVVNTETPEVQAERRNVLRLLLARYRPGKGGGDNELLALAARYGIPSRGRPWAEAPGVDTSNPFIVVDRGACIHCWRCVRACDLLNGVAAIGVFGRGVDAQIGFGFGGPMQESTCEFCGMCEAVCPTDALTIAGAPPLDPAASTVSTVCSYCGVGCRLNLHVARGRIVSTSPDWQAPANHGLLCVKGRFGWPYVHHPDRLRRPLVRRALLDGGGPNLVETDWDTALDLVARTLVRIAEAHGPDALGFLASAKCSNEENYLIKKLFTAGLGLVAVSNQARI